MRFLPLLPLLLWLSLAATSLAFGQSDRQKQLLIKSIIEHGNALMQKHAFKEALADYEKCVAMDPGNITARSNIVLLHDNWGVYYFAHNQYQDAQVEWETALQLNPKDAKAKRNMLVLKNTLAHMGLDLNTESNLIKQEKEVEHNQNKSEGQSAVVILGGSKNEVPDKDYVNQYYSHEPGGNAISPKDSQIETRTAEPKANEQSAKIATPTPVREAQVTKEPHDQSMIEQTLSRIERKVYGRPLDELPVIKRLEKLEADNFGQISTLPILERVQKLNQLYPAN